MLLAEADQDSYWMLPGGRVELGEDTRAALKREFLEEADYDARTEGLLRIVGAFFHLGGTDYHELAFIYSIFPTTPTHRTTDDDARITLRWFELAHLEAVDFQPAFLKPLLQAPPETTQQVIVKEPRQT